MAQFLGASPQLLPASPGVRTERQPGTLAPRQVTHSSPQASGAPQVVQAFIQRSSVLQHLSLNIIKGVVPSHTGQRDTSRMAVITADVF